MENNDNQPANRQAQPGAPVTPVMDVSPPRSNVSIDGVTPAPTSEGQSVGISPVTPDANSSTSLADALSGTEPSAASPNMSEPSQTQAVSSVHEDTSQPPLPESDAPSEHTSPAAAAAMAAASSPKKKKPVAAIIVAIILALGLAAAVVVFYLNSQDKKTDTSANTTTTKATTTTVETKEVTAADVETASKQLDTDLSSVDEAKDFPTADLEDATLGLQ